MDGRVQVVLPSRPTSFLGIFWSGQFADQTHTNAIKRNFIWRF
jgi:hypothetical protein